MAKIRRRIPNPSYQSREYPELGGWNPTLNDGGEDTNELYELKNLRMQTRGQYQQRSGYKQWRTPVNPTDTVLSKGEYNVLYQDLALGKTYTVGFDITLVYDSLSGNVVLVLFNKLTQSIQFVKAIAVGVSLDPDQEMAACVQYANYLLITVFSKGVYALYPTNDPLHPGASTKTMSILPDDWTLFLLGKDLANTPVVNPVTGVIPFTFAATTSADLLVRQSHTVQNNEQALDYQPGLAEANIIRLNIQAKYWLTNDAAFSGIPGMANKLKLWQWNVNDPNNYDPTGIIPAQSTDHLQTNAWGYRAVFVQQFIDTEGNAITYRSQASVDFWVPNRMYAPAYLGYDGTNGSTKGDFADQIITSGYSAFPRFWLNDVVVPPYPENGNGGGMSGDNLVLVGYPSNHDLIDLSAAYRTYFHAQRIGFQGTQGAADPYTFAAGYLGWLNGNPAGNFNFLYGGSSPYVIPVSAYDLRNAPMTVFHWSDFSSHPDFPANTIKIELYRTAFNGTAINETIATNPLGNPLFQPHIYGYAGTINKDETFTDSVQDAPTANGGPADTGYLDFGKTPKFHDGLLAAQFSGKVIREYNDKVAIGNITTDYWVFAPSPVQQAIAVQLTNALSGDVTTVINTKYKFYYQYEDDDGNVSDLTQVIVDTSDTGAHTSHVFFKIPLGYAPNITNINIIQKNTDLPVRYDLIAKVGTNSGFYKYPIETALNLYTKLTQNVKTPPEPGGIIYGQGNQIMAYPPTNIEVISKIWPITAMEVILGRLWVWTERGLFYTLLAINQNGNTVGEEETIFGGNLGFHTLSKANKIVFFLSAHGLMFAESSGVQEFSGTLQNLILPYLNEVINGKANLLNARRASVQWLGQRDELWVHFPSSADLGGELPERTFIYKLWNGVPIMRGNPVNYEFDLINSLDPSLNPIIRPVVLYGHSDGTLFSAYIDPANNELVVMNNDVVSEKWLGQTVLEKRITLNTPTKKKKVRTVAFRADGVNKMWFLTGRPYPGNPPPPANTPDYYGQLYKGGEPGGVRKFLLENAGSSDGQAQLYKRPINGPTVESTAYIPAIRIVTEPIGGEHTVTYYSLSAYLTDNDHV